MQRYKYFSIFKQNYGKKKFAARFFHGLRNEGVKHSVFFCRTDYTDYTDLFMIAVYSQCEDNYGPENGERIHGRLPPSVP